MYENLFTITYIFMEIAIQFVGKYWSYLNLYITDKIYILIWLAQVIHYWISFVGCDIVHYLDQWRYFTYDILSHEITWNPEALWLIVSVIISLWNLTSTGKCQCKSTYLHTRLAALRLAILWWSVSSDIETVSAPYYCVSETHIWMHSTIFKFKYFIGMTTQDTGLTKSIQNNIEKKKSNNNMHKNTTGRPFYVASSYPNTQRSPRHSILISFILATHHIKVYITLHFTSINRVFSIVNLPVFFCHF